MLSPLPDAALRIALVSEHASPLAAAGAVGTVDLERFTPLRHEGGRPRVFTAAGIDACGTLDSVATDAWERVVRVILLGTAAVVVALSQPPGREVRELVVAAPTEGSWP